MKQHIRRLVAPWVIGLLPFAGCATMSQSSSSIMPQWIAGSANLDAKLAYGRLCERHGQTKQAHDIYSTLAKSNNSQAKQMAYHRLGVMAAKRGEYREANENLAQAAQVQTPSAELLNDLGYNFYLMDNLTEAEACFRQALAKDPHYLAAQNNLGLALGQQGKFDDAMKAFAKTGNSSQAHTNMAYVYAQHRYLDQARQHYLKALGHDERNERAAEGLVQVAKATEQLNQAVASKTNPSNPIGSTPSSTAAAPLKQVASSSRSTTPSSSVVDGPQPTLAASRPSVASEQVASTRRTETGNVSPWAPSERTQAPTAVSPHAAANPTVAAVPSATPQLATLASSLKPPAVPTTMPPTLKPIVAPLSQPAITTSAPTTLATAPVVPSVSLPRPTLQPRVESSVAQRPIGPNEPLWATKEKPNDSSSNSLVAEKSTVGKSELPQVALGQPTSLATPVPQPATVAVSTTSSLLPANPVQIATPSLQTGRSAVVTAGHAQSGDRATLEVANASPNALPETPTRLPPVTTPTAERVSASQLSTPDTKLSRSFPSTATEPAARVGKQAAASTPLVSGLIPTVPQNGRSQRSTATGGLTQPASQAAVQPAAFVGNRSTATTDAPATANSAPSRPATPAPAQPILLPKTVQAPSVLPQAVKPQTPLLPSQPAAAPAPVLKNQPATQSKLADKFAQLKAAKDQSAISPQPSSSASTLPQHPMVQTVELPNQSIPGTTQPNLAVQQPIRLEINGQPSTGGNPAPAKSQAPVASNKGIGVGHEPFKVPGYRVPSNEVPPLYDSYRTRGLGLDGKAGS